MALSVRNLANMATALVGGTFALIVFGAAVRANGAGLACPDWPLCFGEVVPAINVAVALEFGHRVFAGGVALVYLALFGGLVVRRREVGRPIVGLAVFGLGVLVLQIVLGGLTVLELLAEWTVTSHLLAGNVFCLTLFALALALRDVAAPIRRRPITAGQRVAAGLVALVVPVQMALGGLVSSSYAGLVCPSWPTCAGTVWFPTFEGLIGLQLSHRLVAYGLLAAAGLAVLATRGEGRTGRSAWAVLMLVLLQASLGVANVLFQLPLEVTLLHSAGATSIVLATTWLNYEAWRAPLVAVHEVQSWSLSNAAEAK